MSRPFAVLSFALAAAAAAPSSATPKPYLDKPPAEAASAKPPGEAASEDIAAAAEEVPFDDPNERRRVGGWGGLTTGVTQINHQAAQTFGFAGGVLFNERLTVGVAGAGIASWVEADGDLFKRVGPDAAPHFVEGGWGGLHLAYEPFSRFFVHPMVSATLGLGAVTYSQRQLDDGWDDDWDIDAEIHTEEDRPVGVFGATEVAAGGTLNVARWCRLDVTVAYRWISGLDEFEGLTNAELGGATLGLGLRFGSF